MFFFSYRRQRHSTISKEDELAEAKTLYETVFDVKGTLNFIFVISGCWLGIKWASARENLSSGGLRTTKAKTSLHIRAV